MILTSLSKLIVVFSVVPVDQFSSKGSSSPQMFFFFAAGVYGFYVFLNNDRDWQLVLSSNSTGDPDQYDRNDDVLRLAVTPEEAPYRERLQFGIENFTDEEADLYLHWEKKKAVLQLEMTGELRRRGFVPEVPDDAKPAWEVAKSSLDAFLAEDIEKHIRDFADDFETDFGDGGSTGAHVQLLDNLRRGRRRVKISQLDRRPRSI